MKRCHDGVTNDTIVTRDTGVTTSREAEMHAEILLGLLDGSCRKWDPHLGPEDSKRWERLLKIAFVEDGNQTHGIYGMLDGLRCLGAGLQQGQGRLALTRGDIPLDEWQRIRGVWLEPRRAKLLEMLTKASPRQTQRTMESDE